MLKFFDIYFINYGIITGYLFNKGQYYKFNTFISNYTLLNIPLLGFYLNAFWILIEESIFSHLFVNYYTLLNPH